MVAPAATVTAVGVTVATEALLLDSVTVVAVGAAPLSVTVPATEPPPVIDVELSEIDERVGGGG